MGFKTNNHPRCHPKMRLITIHLLQNHKRLAIFLSLLLLTLIYHFSQLSSSQRRQPYGDFDTTRSGLGGKDAHGELGSVLKRGKEGRAAVAIIRVVDSPVVDGSNSTATSASNDGNNDSYDNIRYLVQIKSHDYPITAFRGTICLLGGNAKSDDVTPLNTLKRELNEELYSPGWVDEINAVSIVNDSALQIIFPNGPFYNVTTKTDEEAKSSMTTALSTSLPPGSIRYLGTTLHSQSAQIMQRDHPKSSLKQKLQTPSPYSFFCALYEITLHASQLPPSILYPRGATVQEGRLALLTREQLMRHAKFAWGYDFSLMRYFGARIPEGNLQRGVEVGVVEETYWDWEEDRDHDGHRDGVGIGKARWTPEK
eukprot:CAMPEP_0171331890 /NCGR_PEP_ID=MMETSP0878-20121228/3010_1 /TAXON_ID=67004 /ORGANISM="Thalassiosira weissflogii, Strain CCMP1336" /LENGTH=367 /DNA_ID=CAMNT_0011832539 /DNA_START=52 /DNA_END=1155 /DNA_ORIENTATION=+